MLTMDKIQFEKGMTRWFENKLFPMMLECEDNIKSAKRLESGYDKNQTYMQTPSVYNSQPSYSEHSNYDECEDNVDMKKLSNFLQKSAAHRHRMEEVRRQREIDEAQYVPDTQGPVEIPPPSDSAPTVQPHKSRYDALLSLYGRRADTIVSMETTLQTRFDQITDATQPRYWPIIPLKF